MVYMVYSALYNTRYLHICFYIWDCMLYRLYAHICQKTKLHTFCLFTRCFLPFFLMIFFLDFLISCLDSQGEEITLWACTSNRRAHPRLNSMLKILQYIFSETTCTRDKGIVQRHSRLNPFWKERYNSPEFHLGHVYPIFNNKNNYSNTCIAVYICLFTSSLQMLYISSEKVDSNMAYMTI